MHVFFTFPNYDEKIDMLSEFELNLIRHNLLSLWQDFVASSLMNKIGYLISGIARKYGKCPCNVGLFDVC